MKKLNNYSVYPYNEHEYYIDGNFLVPEYSRELYGFKKIPYWKYIKEAMESQ